MVIKFKLAGRNSNKNVLFNKFRYQAVDFVLYPEFACKSSPGSI